MNRTNHSGDAHPGDPVTPTQPASPETWATPTAPMATNPTSMAAAPGRRRRFGVRFDPREVGWRIGTAWEPRGGELWCPWDRTAGVIGPQGSGKTLDLLTPALLGCPGPAMVTLTKVDDLLLTWTARQQQGPCVVLDPFGLAPGLPELVWDPIDGCVDPLTAEKRAKAFTFGTIRTGRSGASDDAARFYATEAAIVLQCYFHAAALTGQTLDAVLGWVAKPLSSPQPVEILTEHPMAAPSWAGLLHGALHGDDRTTGNTIATVHQALELFFQPTIRHRCVPTPQRPAVNVADIIANNGTFYLLGREDPYLSASPLMTAVAEHILDTSLTLANNSPWGRLCPPMLSCLDEMPSTAPLPTLITRMANERALGLSFIWAAQTRRQLDTIYGPDQARALFGLTNVLVLFGGSKDVDFNKEVSDLVGPVRVARTSWNLGHPGGRTSSGDDIPIITADEVRQIPARQALVVAENAKPLLAKLTRSIDGRTGRALLAQQSAARKTISGRRREAPTPRAQAADAVAEARRLSLIRDDQS